MRLAELVAGLPGARLVGAGSVEISELVYDSRKAGPGALFFCVVGHKVDGHDFAPRVVEAGAAALVVERELTDLAVPQVVVPDSRAAMAPVAARFYGDPTRELRVVGITGTNGKTTTAFLVREILQAADFRCGLLGTVKQVVGGVEKEVVRTTPEAVELQGAFRQMIEGGDEACAIEVSSHALSLHRADAIHFEVALFTNLTQDHLDFHVDMEDYFRAKRLLFDMSPAAVVTTVHPYAARLPQQIDCVTVSAEGIEADFRALRVDFDATGSRFHASTIAGEIDVETPMPGHFNVA